MPVRVPLCDASSSDGSAVVCRWCRISDSMPASLAGPAGCCVSQRGTQLASYYRHDRIPHGLLWQGMTYRNILLVSKVTAGLVCLCVRLASPDLRCRDPQKARASHLQRDGNFLFQRTKNPRILRRALERAEPRANGGQRTFFTAPVLCCQSVYSDFYASVRIGTVVAVRAREGGGLWKTTL